MARKKWPTLPRRRRATEEDRDRPRRRARARDGVRGAHDDGDEARPVPGKPQVAAATTTPRSHVRRDTFDGGSAAAPPLRRRSAVRRATADSHRCASPSRDRGAAARRRRPAAVVLALREQGSVQCGRAERSSGGGDVPVVAAAPRVERPAAARVRPPKTRPAPPTAPPSSRP